MDSWHQYTLPDVSFTDFHAGAMVVDVGSGPGDQLAQLLARGIGAIGVEPDAGEARQSRMRGHTVVRALAEALPFRAGSLDGVLCKVVLPYTDERRAIAEFARVLRPGAQCLLVGHGSGYYLRYLLEGPGAKRRIYAMRTLANTGVYRLTSRRLPGWIGDSIFQSPKRLGALYRDNGLFLVSERLGPTYRGLPVFLYHLLMRDDDAPRRSAAAARRPGITAPAG